MTWVSSTSDSFCIVCTDCLNLACFFRSLIWNLRTFLTISTAKTSPFFLLTLKNVILLWCCTLQQRWCIPGSERQQWVCVTAQELRCKFKLEEKTLGKSMSKFSVCLWLQSGIKVSWAVVERYTPLSAAWGWDMGWSQVILQIPFYIPWCNYNIQYSPIRIWQAVLPLKWMKITLVHSIPNFAQTVTSPPPPSSTISSFFFVFLHSPSLLQQVTSTCSLALILASSLSCLICLVFHLRNKLW